MGKLIYFLFESERIRRNMKRALIILSFLIVLLLAYLVPYTILRSESLAWLTYPFWCIDTLIAIALMFYITSKWRD
ncbi:MAG: hypothetical protein DRJ60_02505 [Thermoprotei archaeon]|nr:MAG: hypothetical protein DRJ60_02505 [Thermoprotei archaeon]